MELQYETHIIFYFLFKREQNKKAAHISIRKYLFGKRQEDGPFFGLLNPLFSYLHIRGSPGHPKKRDNFLEYNLIIK